MPTPNREHGSLYVEGVVLDESSAPTVNGELRYVNGVGFRFFENGAETGLTGSGISEGAHEALDTLAHRLAETSFCEVVKTAGRVTSVVVWETSSKLKKVRETLVTRSAQDRISTVVEKQYDGGGALQTTLTHTMSRSSDGSLTSVDVVRT